MSELSRMYSRLRTLERSLKDWENRKKIATDNRDKARKRQNKIKDLKKDLERDFDDNAKNVNKNAEKMVDKALNGIIGNQSAGNLNRVVSANKEREPESDPNLSRALSELNTENSRLQSYYDDRVREIEQCKREISRIKKEISDLKRAIARKEREDD